MIQRVFRWYRCGLGRYTQSDPLGVGGLGHFEEGRLQTWAGSPIARRVDRSRSLAARLESEVNGYNYAGANPLSFVDRHGLSVFPPLSPNNPGEPILCTVYALTSKPFLKTCAYVGRCTGLITRKSYLAAGAVLVPDCKECSPVCTYESTAGAVAPPDNWECNPPMKFSTPKWFG